jgi:hypothetical protein
MIIYKYNNKDDSGGDYHDNDDNDNKQTIHYGDFTETLHKTD